jgi:DNA repair ATPase RecN
MIELDILNVKNITNLKISLPYKKGLYAITGINGIGKSTIFTALAKLVYKSALDKYLKFDGDGTSKIAYTLDGVTNVFEKTDKWKRTDLSPVEYHLGESFC